MNPPLPNPWRLNATEAEALDAVCLTGSAKAAARHLGIELKLLNSRVQQAGIRMNLRGTGTLRYFVWDRWRHGATKKDCMTPKWSAGK